MKGTASKLSLLWIFASLNYIYCDVLGVMNPELLKGFLAGHVNGIDVSQGFLLGGAVLVEIPMAMVVAARLLGPRASRWTNIVSGVVMTVVQVLSLFVGTPAPYYIFFSVIEIGCTAAIVWIAWKWSAGVLTAAEGA